MKKSIKLIASVFCILLFSGCSPIGTKVSTCTMDNDQSKSGYKIYSTYKIYSKKDVVSKVESEDVLSSKNTTIIAFFEKDYNDRYSAESKKYKGIKYDVKKSDDKIISKLIMDYSKIDMTEYIKNNSAMKSYVNKDNKLTLEGAKSMYESIGAKCK